MISKIPKIFFVLINVIRSKNFTGFDVRAGSYKHNIIQKFSKIPFFELRVPQSGYFTNIQNRFLNYHRTFSLHVSMYKFELLMQPPTLSTRWRSHCCFSHRGDVRGSTCPGQQQLIWRAAREEWAKEPTAAPRSPGVKCGSECPGGRLEGALILTN